MSTPIAQNLPKIYISFSQTLDSRLTLFIGDNSSGKSYILTNLAQNTKDSILIVDDRATILKYMDIIAPPDDVAKEFIEKFKRIVQEVVGTSIEVPKDLSDVLGLERLSIIDNKLYVTMSNGQVYPLSTSPSSIRSVVPIILALESEFKTVLIDGLEDHLHPNAQRVLTKMIVKAVKSGKSIVLSTNSDYVLSTISIMIGLYHKDRERGLDPKIVSAYLVKLTSSG